MIIVLLLCLLTLASKTAQESKSSDTVSESSPSLCELTIHGIVRILSKDNIHNNVILLQPAVYLYLHRLICQQSPHHQLLVWLLCLQLKYPVMYIVMSIMC